MKTLMQFLVICVCLLILTLVCIPVYGVITCIGLASTAMVTETDVYDDQQEQSLYDLYQEASKKPSSPVSVVMYYQQNEIAADRDLKGKVLCVRGRVHSVQRDILGDPQLIMEGPQDSFRSLQFIFDTKWEEVLAALRPQQDVVTACGVCSGLMMNVLFRDCLIMEVNKQSFRAKEVSGHETTSAAENELLVKQKQQRYRAKRAVQKAAKAQKVRSDPFEICQQWGKDRKYVDRITANYWMAKDIGLSKDEIMNSSLDSCEDRVAFDDQLPDCRACMTSIIENVFHDNIEP